MLEPAIEALKTYQPGVDPKVLQPLEKAILSLNADAAASQALEIRLAEVLRGEAPHAAKDAVCRLLRTFGSAASVPALAALLADEKLSHMARYALERIPAPEAGRALIDALPKTKGITKIGVITSLGVRAEAQGVPALAPLLADRDAAIARSAALALADHGTRGAAESLLAAAGNTEAMSCVADALLACAERLAASGDNETASTIYKKLDAGGFPESIRSAAQRGLEAVSR